MAVHEFELSNDSGHIVGRISVSQEICDCLFLDSEGRPQRKDGQLLLKSLPHGFCVRAGDLLLLPTLD